MPESPPVGLMRGRREVEAGCGGVWRERQPGGEALFGAQPCLEAHWGPNSSVAPGRAALPWAPRGGTGPPGTGRGCFAEAKGPPRAPAWSPPSPESVREGQHGGLGALGSRCGGGGGGAAGTCLREGVPAVDSGGLGPAACSVGGTRTCPRGAAPVPVCREGRPPSAVWRWGSPSNTQQV